MSELLIDYRVPPLRIPRSVIDRLAGLRFQLTRDQIERTQAELIRCNVLQIRQAQRDRWSYD